MICFTRYLLGLVSSPKSLPLPPTRYLHLSQSTGYVVGLKRSLAPSPGPAADSPVAAVFILVIFSRHSGNIVPYSPAPPPRVLVSLGSDWGGDAEVRA